MHIPGDVLLRVQADIRQHAGEEEVGTAPEASHADGFPLQVTDRAHLRGPIQFVAAPVDPRQEDEWGPAIQPADQGEHTHHAEIGLAGGQGLPEVPRDVFDIGHLGEPLAVQQLLGHELWRRTDGSAPPAHGMKDPERRGFGRGLRPHPSGRQTEQPRRPRHG
jgi:hypothetical protein